MSVVYILLLIFSVFDVLSSAPTLNSFSGLNDESNDARRDVIVFHLRRGYEILNGAVPCYFKELTETHKRGCEYSMQFYINAVKCCSVREQNNLILPKDVICFDDGHCVDIGDPGIHPGQH